MFSDSCFCYAPQLRRRNADVTYPRDPLAGGGEVLESNDLPIMRKALFVCCRLKGGGKKEVFLAVFWLLSGL